MTTKPRKQFRRDVAADLALQLEKLLAPAAERITVAGSIRRGRDYVTDADLVIVPTMEKPPGQLFDCGDRVPITERALAALLADPASGLSIRANGCNGVRLKRLQFEGLPVDLNIVMPPATYGYKLAIATGPADWNELLVTKRSHGGAFPDAYTHRGGAIFHIASGGQIPTDTERDYFTALGIPWIEPAERSAGRLKRYLKQKAPHPCSY